MALVSVNGVVSKPEEAKVSVYDRGFLFGDAVYEVTRSYGKVFFALEEHVSRLQRSAERIGLHIGLSSEHLVKSIYDLAKRHGKEDVYIRIQISRGVCAFKQVSLKPSNTGPANIVMYLHDYQDWDESFFTQGIHISSSQVIRNQKQSLDPNIKSGNYLNNIMSIVHANTDADDAFLLNENSEVCEGSTFNLFMVKDSVVIHPPDDSDILHGITRSIVEKICKENSIKMEKKRFSLDSFLKSDEGFCTSATKEVMPIRKIDDTKIISPGPITSQLMSLYKKYVNEYVSRMAEVHPIEY